MRIDVYSHYVRVTDFNSTEEEAILETAYDLIQWDVNYTRNGVVRTKKCVFAVSNKLRTEYRFHIGSYQDLRTRLISYGVDLSKVDLVKHPIPEPLKVEYQLSDGWVPREGQRLALEYLFQEPPPHVGMIPLQAGAGKTATTFFALERAKTRGLLFIKPNLMKQWADSYLEIFKSTKKDVMMVTGGAELLGIIDMAQRGVLEAKFIIISLNTFQSYITKWEDNSGTNDTDVPLHPEEIINLLRPGMVVTDEWHLFFHLNFKIDLFLNVPRVVKLSATPEPDDKFLASMFALVSPLNTRFEGIPYNKYVNVTGLNYSISKPEVLRTSARGRTSYSHGEFEKSLKKRRTSYSNYLDMIEDRIRLKFIDWRKEKPTRKGARMIVYAALQDTCTDIRDRLRSAFPGVKIDRVISLDKKSLQDGYLKDSEILVSTIGSVGVGSDISDLMYVLMTTSVSSKEANEQTKGRLREPKPGAYEGDLPLFEYLYTEHIPRQREYHVKKMGDFRGKCVSHVEEDLPNWI